MLTRRWRGPRLLLLEVVLGECPAAAIIVEGEQVDVVVQPFRRAALGEIAAPADRDGSIAVDGVRLIAGGPAARLVALALVSLRRDPGANDLATAHDWLIPGVVAVLDALGKQVADGLRIVAPPGVDIAIQPVLHVVLGHG